MRIVAVSRILDEADIIEAFLRHTATFVDHHVVLDNGSRDGTLEIMKNLHNEGLNLSIYSTNSICFSERNLNNWLFNEALDNHAPIGSPAWMVTNSTTTLAWLEDCRAI